MMSFKIQFCALIVGLLVISVYCKENKCGPDFYSEGDGKTTKCRPCKGICSTEYLSYYCKIKCKDYKLPTLSPPTTIWPPNHDQEKSEDERFPQYVAVVLSALGGVVAFAVTVTLLVCWCKKRKLKKKKQKNQSNIPHGVQETALMIPPNQQAAGTQECSGKEEITVTAEEIDATANVFQDPPIQPIHD